MLNYIIFSKGVCDLSNFSLKLGGLSSYHGEFFFFVM